MPDHTTPLPDLVARMPKPDEKLRILSNVDKEATDQVLAQMEKGGRETLVALVGHLADPAAHGGKITDSQARHALHALATRAAGRGDDARRDYAQALASTLDAPDRPAEVKAFLIRQIQLAGTKEVAPALGKCLTDEHLAPPAAQALLAIRDGAAEQFRQALPKSKGKPRVAIIQGLGVLKDPAAAPDLRKLAADEDRDTRLTALWALANTGDAQSADLLTKAADTAQGYERVQANKSLLLLADTLFAAGKKDEAVKIYRHLRDTRTDPAERYLREAAAEKLLGEG